MEHGRKDHSDTIVRNLGLALAIIAIGCILMVVATFTLHGALDELRQLIEVNRKLIETNKCNCVGESRAETNQNTINIHNSPIGEPLKAPKVLGVQFKGNQQ